MENLTIRHIPNRVHSYNDFNVGLRDRLGIVIAYKPADAKHYNEVFYQLSRENSFIVDILKVNYIVFPLQADLSESQAIIIDMDTSIEAPSIVFISSQSKSSNRKIKILGKIQGRLNLEEFKEHVISNLEVKTNSSRLMTGNQSLIEKQKAEFEELELQEQMKEKNRLDESTDRRKAKRIKDQEQKAVQEFQSLLPEEPSAEDATASRIIFRCPDGDRRFERRFNKTDKIACLYYYVHSLGKSIFEESENFDLVQPFPFKVYDDREKTLQEEKLFPNAVLQIREI